RSLPHLLLRASCTARVLRRGPCFVPPAPSARCPSATLSLHDALPIYHRERVQLEAIAVGIGRYDVVLERRDDEIDGRRDEHLPRSEEHTSELQSRVDLVCRLLLEKKKSRRPADG